MSLLSENKAIIVANKSDEHCLNNLTVFISEMIASAAHHLCVCSLVLKVTTKFLSIPILYTKLKTHCLVDKYKTPRFVCVSFFSEEPNRSYVLNRFQ